MIKWICLFTLILSGFLEAADKKALKQFVHSLENPFAYKWHPTFYSGPEKDENVLVALHGMGGDYSIGKVLQSYDLPYHIISLNLPDYALFQRNYHVSHSCFGTIQEVIPVIYLLNQLVSEAHLNAISLYGFSAGGGLVVNVLATLNDTKYDKELADYGIYASDKQKIIKALEKGKIYLDAPLKSVEEIIVLRGPQEDFLVLEKQYRKNDMTPIDSIKNLKGLKLNITVFFQTPDEILHNRDDDLFEQRLREVNTEGKTRVIKQNEGGHNGFHVSLWK